MLAIHSSESVFEKETRPRKPIRARASECLSKLRQMQTKKMTTMAETETDLARDGDGDARSSAVVAAHSGGDLMRVNEELHRGEDGEDYMKLVNTGYVQGACERDGYVPSQIQRCGGGERGDSAGDNDGDELLLSADALLFMLEEDEEELLIPDSVNADAIDLADLDFSDRSGSTADLSEDQHDILCSNLEPTNRDAVLPLCADEKPRKHPGKPKSSELRSYARPSRVRKLWTLQPVAAPVTVSVQSNGSAPQPDPKKTNSGGGRKRVKDELEYLRQHVSDLEEQLRQLKPRQGDHSQSMRDSSSSSSNSLSSTLWKRVASHQQDARRKAEAENARLRDLLEAQLRLARSLARTLRKRPNLADVNPILSESEVNWRQLNLRSDAAASVIFAHLEESVGPLYASVDAVLLETGFTATCKREIRESQVKMDARGHLFLEIVDSTIVPFDLETTSAGYWKFYSHSPMDHRHELCSLKSLDVTSDTLRAQVSARLPVQHGGVEALVQGHMIGKQFIEETRVVGVWNSVGELKSKLFGDDRITLRETGWTVIEAMPSSETGGSPSSIIQMVVRMTPDVGESHTNGSFVSEKQSSHVGMLTDLVLGSFQQNLESMHQMTESMILAEMAQTVCVFASFPIIEEIQEEEDLAMAFNHVGGGEGGARDFVVTGASSGGLLAVSEELRGDRGGERNGKLNAITELLGEDERDDDFAAPAQVPQRDGGERGDSAGDNDGDELLLSADALLFMLEEDEEELLIPDSVNADAIDLADLDFSDRSGSTADLSEDQHDILCSNLEPTNRDAVLPLCADEKPRKHPGKPKSSELRSYARPSRVRKLWTLQPVAAPVTVSVQSNGSAPQPDPKKTNSGGGRKRVKDELEYLRQHVSDLEEQLRQLKPRQGDHSQSMRDSSSSSSNSLSSTLWKRVASHQQDARRKAEAENARLRDLLEAQLRLARSLARTLRKRPNLADVGPMHLNSEVTWRQLNPHTTSEVFAHLEETIGPLYANLDGVLLETGLSGATNATALTREIQESQVKMDACGRLFLEIVDSSILPFDLQSTSRGFWKLFCHSTWKELQYGMCSLKATDLTTDTLRAEFSVSWPVQNTEALGHGHLLGKQIIEENRVVYVRSCVGELKTSLLGSERIAVRETGWTVIKELPSTETGGSPSSIIQMVVRMTPDVGESHTNGSFVSENQSNHVGLLTDIVLGSFQQNLESMHQMIESMVLTEMA